MLQRRAATIFRRRSAAVLVRGETVRRSGFASRDKIAAARRPPLRSGRERCSLGRARRLVIAAGREGRGRFPTEGITMTIDRDDGQSSPTARVLEELELHGWRPFQDEPDPRPLPEGDAIAGTVASIFDALAFVLDDTRLEPDLGDLLWSTVNVFHRAAQRIERHLDANEQDQRRSQREQDGSEVKSVQLERLINQGTVTLGRADLPISWPARIIRGSCRGSLRRIRSVS